MTKKQIAKIPDNTNTEIVLEALVRFDHSPDEALTAAEQALIMTYGDANDGYGPPGVVEAARRLHREAEEKTRSRTETEKRERRQRHRRKRDREAAAAHVAARLWQAIAVLEPDTARSIRDDFVGFNEFAAWIETHSLRLDTVK